METPYQGSSSRRGRCSAESCTRTRDGVQDPVDNLHTAASRKLEKLRAAEPDITNPPAMIGYWERICEQLKALTTTRASSLSPVTAPIWEEGVPCDVCGLYFSSTKTMRQHRARKHQVLVQINPKEEAQYQPHEHSLNGLPQCKRCNLKLSSADALKQHVLTYACRPRKAVDQGARGDAEPTARNNAERRPAEDTVTPPLSTGSPPHRPQHDAAPEETAPGPDLPLLRSREASAYLRQEQIPLQVLTDWAPKLLQHCGFCNHWVAQGGSVKEHIKRMHQCIWDAALERFDDCCLAHESLILRDHPCELCHQTVYTKARHLRNCVVLAQVSIAQAWIKAGAPEANEVCSISPSDFNEATAKRLLWGGPEEYSQADAPLLRYLERQCVSCGQQLTNQQDWRRHMRKVHKQTWEEAERHLSGTASRVQFVRPCKFCRVHFTKTPQLHSQKCLPLLQLAYIQHHGRPVGPEGGGQTVGHDLANGTHVGRRAGQGSASQVPQNQGQFGLRAAKRAWEPRSAPTQVPAQQLQMMAKIIARHEAALQLLEADRSWILFMEAGELGIIPQLMQTTATWKKSRAQGTCKCGLRQALMGALLMELAARLQKLGPAQQRLSKAKLLSTEPLAWRYVKWNQDKQCHEPTEAAPLQHDNAIKSTQVLTEHMVRDGVIHAFHALGGMAADKDKTTMFKLTLSMEGPKKQQISGPSRSGESKDAQSASGSRGDKPTITSWLVQPKPSGDGQNDRKRGASQSDVARQTQSLPNLTLHNPGNHCYLNSLVQALCWIYFAVPSDRNSVFGDLHPLLRPLLSAKGRVQLLRRSAWRSLLQG